jgi:soluble cytochrome b562
VILPGRGLLVTPITLEHVKEVTWFDGMREEILKETKYIEKASQESMRIQASAKEYQEKAQKLHEKLQTWYKHLREEKKHSKHSVRVAP